MATAHLRLNTPTSPTTKKHVARRNCFREQRVTRIAQIEGQPAGTHFCGGSASGGCLVQRGCSLARHFYPRGGTRSGIGACLITSVGERSTLLRDKPRD